MASDNENADVKCTSPEIQETEEITSLNVLPKSKKQYKLAYNQFMAWRVEKQVNSFTEKAVLTYFLELANEKKPSTLWTYYSMLRSTLSKHHNVQIEHYHKLRTFLKRQAENYQPKKAKSFSPEEVHKFIIEAPDVFYLATKVALIMGVVGACRRDELYAMQVQDLQDLKTAFSVTVPNSKTKGRRKFMIREYYYSICKKYIDLRPPHVATTALFLNYHNGKCSAQRRIGINKFGGMAKDVAIYLKLPNPELFTGHCFRKSSTNSLMDRRGRRGVVADLSMLETWNNTSVIDENVDDQEQVKTEDPSVSVKEEQIEDTSDLIKEEPAIEDSIEMQSFTDYNTDTDNEKEYILEGPRSVDINFFFRSLIQVSNHNYTLGCKLENVKIVGESRHSFSSIIHMRCNMCNMEFNISTTDSSLEVNHSSAVQFVKVEDRSEEFEQSTTLNTTCYQSFQS